MVKTKRTVLLALIAVIALAPAVQAADTTADGKNVVIHLSNYTNDLHASFMALKIGTMIAKAGGDVTLFADLEGVRLADSTAPDDLRWGSNQTTIGDAYDDFVAAGGKILVCPHCAEAAGVTKLRKGAKIATPEQIGQLFLDAGKVIDY